MSQITIVEIEKGDDISTSKPNQTLTQWNSLSTDIDATNIRDEGLDDRSIALRSVTSAEGRDAVSNTATLSGIGGGASNTPVTVGVPIVTDNLVYDGPDGDRTLVRCSFGYNNDAATGGTSQTMGAVILKSTDGGGSYSPIATTLRKVAFAFRTVPGRGSLTISHLFEDATLDTSTLKFGVEVYQDTGAATPDMNIQDISLSAKTFKR